MTPTVVYDAVQRRYAVTVAPHVLLRLRRVFAGLSTSQHGTVTLTDTPAVARDLLWFFERFPVEMDTATRTRLEMQAAVHRGKERAVAEVLAEGYVPKPASLAIPLRSYQQQAVDLVRANHGLLLADDVGTGKTAAGIGLLSYEDARPALVVTLTHLPRQWQAELKRFAPGLRTHILRSGKPYSLTTEGRKDVPFPDVIITNYHKLSGWADVLKTSLKSIVFDEIQELRHGTDTHKGSAAQFLAEAVTYRCGLSATPIHNYGAEIYNVLSFLFPNELGRFDEFANEWCGRVGSTISRSQLREPRVFGGYLREQGMMLRRTRVDIGRELPPFTQVVQEVEGDLDALAEVESSATRLALTLLAQGEQTRGAKMRAAEELSSLLRLATGVSKAPFVADFVRLLVEQGERVVLFGWHHAVYAIWKERLADLKPAFYTGAESEVQKAAAVEAFKSGAARVLVLSLRAGAGLDGLQHISRTAVIGELDYSPAVLHQCFGRVLRDGQKEPVVGYVLLASEGSDPIVADVLGLKHVQSEGLLNPEAALATPLDGSGVDMRTVAREFLRQRGVAIPEVGDGAVATDDSLHVLGTSDPSL